MEKSSFHQALFSSIFCFVLISNFKFNKKVRFGKKRPFRAPGSNLLQGELLKQGRLERSYGGVADCVRRTLNNEGVAAFWRGNFASVVRYFPQQVGLLIICSHQTK